MSALQTAVLTRGNLASTHLSVKMIVSRRRRRLVLRHAKSIRGTGIQPRIHRSAHYGEYLLLFSLYGIP